MSKLHIVVVGLNFRTAPVEVRERFAFVDSQLPEALTKLHGTTSIMECAIVTTCNRTELYAVVDRNHLCGHYIRNFMEQWFGLDRSQFTNHLYMYEDEQAIAHLFRVASGLDSMIIGETQILGQVKDAYQLALAEGTTGSLFNKLFKQAVTVAKRAHTETSISESAVSVSYAAVELGRQIFGDFRGKTVMIIGAGKMSELTAKHLHANGASHIIVVNRTLAKAIELADKFDGTPCSMEQLLERLATTDIVISSTNAKGHILTKEQLEPVMEMRASKPLFMIDIAVPRDLDPRMLELDNVFLYDIDDLANIVESNLEQRRMEAEKIEQMIVDELDQYRQWYRTLDVVPLIQKLQQKTNDIHEATLESMLNKLPELDERQRKVIRKLTKSMLNQLVQDPIVNIKEMASGRRGDEAMDTFEQLFNLQEVDDAVSKPSELAKAPVTTEIKRYEVSGV